MVRSAQGGHAGRRVAHLEHGVDFRRQAVVAVAVIAAGRIEHQNGLALLAEDAALGFLAERALGDQVIEPGRDIEVAMPRIARQGVAHGLDDMGQGVEANDIAGPEGGALRAPDLRTGQAVDGIQAEAEGSRVMHDRQNREDADPVGDEVRRIEGTDNALAEARGQPGF